MSMSINADLSGLNDILDELGDAVESAVRPAAQAAAQVLYSAVRGNVSQIGKKSGNLDKSIYQKYSVENSGPGHATYNISWNAKTAPHGHLLEFGHIQRYAVHVGDDGRWYTLVKPSMRGKPRPKRRASQAEKDAYYVMRKGGPVQQLGKAFVRQAASKMPEAIKAAEDELLKRIAKG